MIPTGPATQVYLALGTTDLRKGFEGLGDLVRHQMKEDPSAGICLSVFTNRNRTRIKLLYWDGSGTWPLTKRLAKSRFSWPQDEGGVPATDLGRGQLSAHATPEEPQGTRALTPGLLPVTAPRGEFLSTDQALSQGRDSLREAGLALSGLCPTRCHPRLAQFLI